jgi:hypothetical protein
MACSQASVRGLVVEVPPGEACLIWVFFPTDPEPIQEFGLSLGSIAVGDQVYATPKLHYSRDSSIRYRAASLPLL